MQITSAYQYIKHLAYSIFSPQNVFLRYGEKHGLLFALPHKANYFGGGQRYVEPFMINSDIHNRLGYDIYAVHSRWNMTTVSSNHRDG